jgi:hypothetical protein
VIREQAPDAIANAIGYAMHRSRSHDAVIRVYDTAGNVIETHEHAGDFKEWYRSGILLIESPGFVRARY